jgi:hypothetical protein
MDDNRDKKLSDQLKAVKEWAAGLLALVLTLMSVWLALKQHPGIVVPIVAAVAAAALWLTLLYVRRTKGEASLIIGGTRGYKYSTRRRRSALAGLVILPVAVVSLAVRFIRPPAPPPPPPPPPVEILQCPPLTVSVAAITPASHSERDLEVAERVRTNLGNELKLVETQGHLKVKDEGQVHVEISGTVLRYRPITVQVFVKRKTECDDPTGAVRVKPTGPLSTEPDVLPFTVEASNPDEMDVGRKMAEVARFLGGYSVYVVRDLRKANEELEGLHVPIAYLYKGLVYWELAHQSPEPKQFYEKAIDSYQQVLGTNWDAAPDEALEDYAYVDAGNALLESSEYYLHQEAQQRVYYAYSFYSKVLDQLKNSQKDKI